ncbi:MAG: 1,4-alpha-glucan branching protein GlgB [Rhizobiales bacterium]|nr:1,4-alpha-glucan branching protein GlgB [Hyphomicrobiales bacterium]
MTVLDPAARAIIEGHHGDPFSYLGPHIENGRTVVRAFLPDASQVVVRHEGGAAELARVAGSSLFAGPVAGLDGAYMLQATYDGRAVEMHDVYRFGPVLTDFDLYLLGEGTRLRAYDRMGAHRVTFEDVEGVSFVVLAPNARRVSVVGDFNVWDGRRNPMRLRGNGFWEIFIPGIREGEHYKYEILGPHGRLLPLKADPYAFAAEQRPKTASIVFDEEKLAPRAHAPAGANALSAPISIYEVHLGSWRRRAGEGERWLTYRELAEELPAYVADMGYTHVEFLPVSEHPFDGSWGYQPTGLYAPTSRFGSPQDFLALVDACHDAGIAVIVDWVPGHFPDDPHGLGQFDGTALFEHADPRQGRHLDWGTLIYNYGRTEIANFLLSNALFWLERYGVDGLRVDAVASMLYLDYSRPADAWVPNRFGGRENLEAIAFLRRFNTQVFAFRPEATTMAEESTAWPMVSRPVDTGGLGFGYKWNMGWMHDTLNYISKDPVHRRHHHGDINFGLHYAFSENFILPLSHDEVVHGKGSILRRMPGDNWQRFANLRAYYAFMFGHPGKKLFFMGNDFGQEREWNHDRSLDWHLLQDPMHRGVHDLMRDLNCLYRSVPALHQLDCEATGFEWLVADDIDQSVFVWLRKGNTANDLCVVAVNFTPVVRRDYRVRVPRGGFWREVLNSDAALYGGSDVGNSGGVEAKEVADRLELSLTLPPLGAIFLIPQES